MSKKFVQVKADADLFLNGTVVCTKPYAVKYGPFANTIKVVCPSWKCQSTSSSNTFLEERYLPSLGIKANVVSDLIYRLDSGNSCLTTKAELKAGFLGKVSVQK